MVKILATGTSVAGLLSATLSLMFSPIPTKLGFYRWLASHRPNLIGMTPAFHYGVDWGYTFQELYGSDLTGQTALVTGANSGVGYETSLALARLGASVTLACRSPRRCDAAAERIRSDEDVRGEVATMVMDTSSLASVKKFAQTYLRDNEALDMLYLNAGTSLPGVANDGSVRLSEDGVEVVFATNVLGHHLLYKLLEPLVMNSTLSRIILTSSASSFGTFDYKVATDLQTLNGADARSGYRVQKKMYAQSKLAQILWAKELTRRLGPDSDVYVNAVHPGAVDTGIWQKIPTFPAPVQNIIDYLQGNVMWNATNGALTMLYLGVATEQLVRKNVRGKYFHPQSQEVVNPLALDVDLQKKVWDFCDELVKDFV